MGLNVGRYEWWMGMFVGVDVDGCVCRFKCGWVCMEV